MNRLFSNMSKWTALITGLLLCGFAAEVPAAVLGIEGTPVGARKEFHLTAKSDFLNTPDGNSIFFWGFAPGTPADGNPVQFPGPTLLIDEGDLVDVWVHNALTAEDGTPLADNVSAVFPGQRSFTIDNGSVNYTQGDVTREALPGGTVRYRFRANNPGTFIYQSGTDPHLQIEMGLVGAMVVYPAAGRNQAYNAPETAFDREYLFFLTDMDPLIHDHLEFGQREHVDFSKRWAVYWMINGRAAPDTMAPDNAPWLPTQPYKAFPRIHPGEKLLMRVVGAGLDLHPYHNHGNHARVVGIDGNLLSSDGTSPDLSYEVFTVQSVPGQTVDAIFDWTAERLGWDIYGDRVHDCVDGDGDGFHDDLGDPAGNGYEYCPDHGKPFPVNLPNAVDLAFGAFWSGSQYMGAAGGLPPGEGGMNPNSGFAFMWHSHTEKELTNFDIFPGGMLTMLIVEPWSVVIEE